MTPIDPANRTDAILDRRFTGLVRAGTDLVGVATWDPALSRRRRVLVPIDVQAFVVPLTAGEPTVAVTGGIGDPAPFAAGALRPAGVHLHWALPDALLAGGHDEPTKSLRMPVLPDRWVVVRTMLPVTTPAARVVRVRGWIVDARSGGMSPLESFTGTPLAGAGPVFDPLDGAAGGSLLWTASYTASAGRFGFHDPLDDLIPSDQYDGGRASYTVAGWWSELADDPLAAAAGPHRLDAVLNELGWHVVHDAADDADAGTDPGLVRLRSGMGLDSPTDDPPTTVLRADGHAFAGPLHGTRLDAAIPVDDAREVLLTPAWPRYASLLHGSVLGVPAVGPLPAADDRPGPSGLGVAIGQDLDDVAAALGSGALALDATHRRSAETLIAAFTSGLVEQLGAPDGLEDLAEREHGDGFWALPGAPLAGAKPDRLRVEDSAPMGPLTVGRKGRAARAAGAFEATLEWEGKFKGLRSDGGSSRKPASDRRAETKVPPAGSSQASAREVLRPAPRAFRPQPPMVAMRGAHPSHRHHGDGLFDEGGRLRCRYPKECATEIEGVVSGAAVLPSLGSGAVPDEVLTVVQEAVVLDPYGHQWLAAASAPTAAAVPAYRARLAAEAVRLYGDDGTYDGSSHLARPSEGAGGSPWRARSRRESMYDTQVAQEVAEFSLVSGTPPSPVAITTWRQPWVPLWLEWQVTLEGTDSVEGWTIDGVDLQPPTSLLGNPVTVTYTGRSPLSQGASTTLREGIRRWVLTEQQRDATGDSTLPTADQNALAQLGDLLAPYDLVSASLDGIREQLLGIPYVGVVERGTGVDPRPTATGLPVPLFGGTLRLDALRLVDAFGRVLDLPKAAIDATATTSELEVAGLAGMRLRPRIQHHARWLFRLVDASQPQTTDLAQAREAFVDQLDPGAAVSPVAGFLLPDHIDEELEAFTPAGVPIGQIGHDAVTRAVTWEPAPGREVPPDAGPLVDLDAQARITGAIAVGLVQADAAARNHPTPPAGSALTALLRAVDTTVWTVDTFAAIGSPTVAGLVGRPITVVRALLALDAPDDVDDVDVSAPGGVPARRAAFAALADQRFPVELGTLTRTDDALLGYFVDDDYRRLHVVDRVVANDAIESGRQRGQLGLLGDVTAPGFGPLAHPYVVPDGTLLIRPGQTVRLTLLMLPLGRVHLSSGVLPRKALALSDEWVGPGLRRLVPSVRVGPVLVDPEEIRLPLVTLLGDDQTFTRRTGPLTWKDDAILAATQSAYLPRAPHEVQEGWVRVTPRPDPGAP
jgi:hypothetical protein